VRTWCAANLLAALALGCHAPTKAPARLTRESAQLPVTARAPIEPDISAIPLESAAPATRPAEYRKLTADDCRVLAIAHAPFADDLDRHSENDPPPHAKPRKPAAQFAEASRLVRGHAADDLRNRAAGEALQEFFKLAETEGQFDLLAAADAELRAQLAAALKAEQSGLKDRADIPGIRRRLLDIEAQQAKLVAGAGALNASLRARLGLAGNDPLPLWPADPLTVRADVVDAEKAVATGLSYRSDLNALRVLADGSAVGLAEGVLQGINPLLGALAPDNPLVALFAPVFAPFTGKPERRQAETAARVAGALEARQRQTEAEIRAATALIRGHRAAVAARALEVQQLEARIEELKARQRAGLNVAAELTTAKLDLLKAKGELLTAVIEWHAAEVKLRQAMGLLVRE
jgi:outer membrane protein TolC